MCIRDRVCAQHKMAYVMTSPDNRTSTERIYEAAQTIPADLYLCINGDEPLIDPRLIEQILPSEIAGFFAANLMTKIHSPVEAVDDSNIKVVTDCDGYALFMSRSPIPVSYTHLIGRLLCLLRIWNIQGRWPPL